jgi:predicted nuclease of predicted toxin-antitoxin system
MLFKIDENLHHEVASLLAAAGHDVETVHSEQLSGCDDARLLAVCRAEKRALVTLDRDFGDLRRYPPHETPGIIVLRIARQDRANLLTVVTRLLRLLGTLPLQGQLWIVTESSVRVRGSN